ncbi:ABC transporter ATP-binding protein [Yanghanlia caeni]|uniref:ABC transporter ATP-binding protein n=1 Tax=Yanghanlia caeni TaxID=3064283 RepID=A0ABU1D9P7_9BURK|nr:ABC transporter ATP-binding protein [Alcaligenaceae bacterium LG-2]
MILLEASNISKSFGGVQAVQGVSFNVQEGHIFSVIGPNGAGKTTLFNLITGVYTADTGSVLLNGKPVHGLPPSELATKGVARTFQNLQICMNMSAIENVMVGAHLHLDRNLIKAALRLPSIRNGDRRMAEEAAALMESVGLGNYIQSHADSLSYGVLKRLEIARALAMKPTILFLDEPAAGLNPNETDEIADVIRQVRDSGITVVLVEHDMKMVMRLSDRILVMESGKTLTEGTADEVRHHPQVIAAYLGAQA